MNSVQNSVCFLCKQLREFDEHKAFQLRCNGLTKQSGFCIVAVVQYCHPSCNEDSNATCRSPGDPDPPLSMNDDVVHTACNLCG